MSPNKEELDIEELLEEFELEARLVENPLWEQKDFSELGFFVGPKHICEAIEEFLEEI